jgi:hypothetical protein
MNLRLGFGGGRDEILKIVNGFLGGSVSFSKLCIQPEFRCRDISFALIQVDR